MGLRLRNYDMMPPGQYFYVQTEGIRKVFKPTPSIQDLARSVSAFRAGNGLPRAGVAETLADIETYTCQRLPNASTWCADTDAPGVHILQPVSGGGQPCAGCGAKV